VQAAAKAGLSLHAWLDRAVRQQFTAERGE
jgi:hypothetical protein